MSEKEIEIEEAERDMIDHWSHEHPLTLVEAHQMTYCYVCERYFRSGEKAYGCSQKCGYRDLLDEECAEAPRKIRHAMHPQHILTQEFHYDDDETCCSICQWYARGILYRCTSAECMFRVHVRCAQGSDVMYAADDDEQSRTIKINHPSHPKHELRFLRRSCSFKCDACGSTRRGSSYTCITDACQYWIHERCATLPQTIKREDHHHYLSLSFHLPPQYVRYDYKCDVCTKRLMGKHWIYHCELCRYVVHLKCAFKKSPHAFRRENDDEKGITMKFPISNVGEDQIGAFVKRQRGATPIPSHDYKFHNHKLRLVSSLSSSQEEKEEEENCDGDGEDDYSKPSELICDGCISPIFRKQRSSSSSSSSSKNDYYMSCSSSGCNFNLHMACFHLPPHLPSLPLHNQSGQDLILQSCDKFKPWECQRCSICDRFTNGLFYACTKCDEFKVDIKCASMPDTIYHAAHPQHPLNLLSKDDNQRLGYLCEAGCEDPSYYYDCYACGSCEFIVHVRCAGLLASTTSRRWDKHHPLPLTHDATLNHPGDFYCDQCEKEMNPKSWMYHCRRCDLSFHPHCFETTTGEQRNIKLGQKYVIAKAHSHTLTYQLLTTKRRCDVCSWDRHEWLGFYCASCNFFVCFNPCGRRMLEHGEIEAVD